MLQETCCSSGMFQKDDRDCCCQ